MQLETAKAMWDKLINSYEGNEKVKYAKLQTYRLNFEQLKMNEDETVSKYFLRFEELVNAMKGLGEKIEESLLVQKILRSLLDKFNPKVSAIEELNDLKTLSIDQLLGTLTAYEMRINKDKSITREACFKADKNTNSDLDDIEAKFVRRLKKGSGKSTRTESVDQRNNTNTFSDQRKHQHGRNRLQPFFRYKGFFCSNFGHKDVNCALRSRYLKSRYSRNNYLPQQRLRQPRNK
jgi:hypothetical protein